MMLTTFTSPPQYLGIGTGDYLEICCIQSTWLFPKFPHLIPRGIIGDL